MQHFSHLDADVRARLFDVPPHVFGLESEICLIATALGATLYVPGTREDLAAVIRKRASEGVRSIVIDLEDAVADESVDDAVRAAIAALDEIARHGDPGCLLFVRVRTIDHLRAVCSEVGDGLAVLAGFVLPKFESRSGRELLDAVREEGLRAGRRFLVMPVLESRLIAHRETREAELSALRELLGQYRDFVLAVRIGATDLCGTFGIRRDRDLTIYEVRVVGDAIASIVNHLGRSDGSGFVVSGPVWEYFADHERMFRPMLRASPFSEQNEVRFRNHLVSRDLDGLLREVALDRANGLLGKTVIHPSHVPAVHALAVVTAEEYHDASDIVGHDSRSGVRASEYRNKMNEVKPHMAWAQATMRRAAAFGVAAEGVSFVDLITALAQR